MDENETSYFIGSIKLVGLNWKGHKTFFKEPQTVYLGYEMDGMGKWYPLEAHAFRFQDQNTLLLVASNQYDPDYWLYEDGTLVIEKITTKIIVTKEKIR